MLNPAPDANAQELRRALGLAQLAFSDTHTKLLDLTKRYNALASEAQRSRKGGRKSKAPSSLEQSISDAAKKCCLFYHLWVPPLLFPVKAWPDIDPRDLSRWQSSEGQIIAKQAELYQMLPSELHKSLMTFPEFSRVFSKTMTEERANIVKNIKDVSVDLFSSLDIKATLFSGDKSLKAFDPKLLGLLKKPGNSQYTQLSPILFVNPTEIRGSDLFKSPVLVKIARVLMFGKAILSNKKRGGPKGRGERMGAQTITEGLIASTATIVRYLLSHDREFAAKGEATGISYQKDFKFYLKLLLHPERRRWALEVIEYFNISVFGTKSSVTEAADNLTGPSSHVHSWEDDLLLEIGNNFDPPMFPSHPPSKPPVSNPGPFAVATNTSAVIHEPGPAPAPRPSFPGRSASSDSLTDVDFEPPMPSLPVNPARPRPRPLNRITESIPPSISVVPQVPVDIHTMSKTSSNGQVTNMVITLSNAVNADLQLEVARLSINPDFERPESAPKSGRRMRATASSGSKSKVGAVAAYPVGAANELGEVTAVPVAPVEQATRSKKRVLAN
ncbi:hypothetical protein HD554DRAFT_2165641 [Boletus coccyginus]|nr:hypothetical protein HD554DRAFT_2165641 [Boletus coccyginus]